MKNIRQNEIMHNSWNGTTDEGECMADNVISSHMPTASFLLLDAKFQEPERGKPVGDNRVQFANPNHHGKSLVYVEIHVPV